MLIQQRRNWIGVCILVLLLTTDLTHTLAQNTAIQPSTVESVVVTATRKASDGDKYHDIFLVKSSQLEIIQAQHIQELLAVTPGVNFQRGNGQEYLPSIRSPVLTGAGSCGTILTAEDGIPLRSAGFCNVNELFEAHTEVAKQIEVVRGSATSMYGSNALHGMINVILSEPQQTRSRLSVEAGSNRYSRLKAVTSLGQEQQFSSMLSLTHDDGFREQSGFTQQKISFKYNNASISRNLQAGITATHLDQETAGFITGLNAYKDPALVRSNPTPEAYRDARSVRAWLRYTPEFDNGSSLQITPYVRNTQMEFLQHFLPGDPLEKNGQTSIGVQSGYYFAPTATSEWVVGMDGELTQADLLQRQDQATQGSAFLMATIPTGRHYDYSVDATTLAAFAYSDWMLGRSWNLISGLRFESVGYDYDNHMLSGRTREDGSECGFGGCRYSRPADRKDRFNNLSSHMTMHYRPQLNWDAYVKLSKSYRVPQATELYRLQRDQLQANLESESLSGIEIGFKSSYNLLNYNIKYYMNKKKNHIFRDSDFFNVSQGKTRHQGIEMMLDLNLSDRISIGVNSNFARHRYAYDQVLNGVNINGNDIDTAPRYFGSAFLNWSVTPALLTQLEWVTMGSYYLDPENAHRYSGHQLVNLRSQWSVPNDWGVSVRLNNLLDRRYADRADYTSFSGERYFPGRGRSVFLSLEKQF